MVGQKVEYTDKVIGQIKNVASMQQQLGYHGQLEPGPLPVPILVENVLGYLQKHAEQQPDTPGTAADYQLRPVYGLLPLRRSWNDARCPACVCDPAVSNLSRGNQRNEPRSSLSSFCATRKDRLRLLMWTELVPSSWNLLRARKQDPTLPELAVWLQ